MNQVLRQLILVTAGLLVASAALAQSGADSVRADSVQVAAPAAAAPPPASGRQQLPATMQVERRGDENPFIEVMNTTRWGGLGGLVIGGAISLASGGDDNGEALRWGMVIGTFAGLGYGIWHVTHRPEPRAALELDRHGIGWSAAPLAAIEVGDGVRVRAVALRF